MFLTNQLPLLRSSRHVFGAQPPCSCEAHVTTGQPKAVRRHTRLVMMLKIGPGLMGLGNE
jgi:hypothetical protein